MIKIFEAKTNKVMWYKNENEIYYFNDIHIHYVINNPSIFDLDTSKIKSIYSLHDEPIGTEGEARKNILEIVMNKGWIRVRCRNNKWFIEVDNFKIRKNNIKKCIEYLLLKSEDMQIDDYISIWDKKNNIHEGIIKNLFQIFEARKL